MLDPWGSIGQRLQGEGEAAKVILLTPELIPIPLVEVSKYRDTMGSRCPLQKCYITIWLLL